MTQHSRSCSFLLLTENEAPQGALLSTESIEVRPLVPKGVCSGLISRQTAISHLVSIFRVLSESNIGQGYVLDKKHRRSILASVYHAFRCIAE